MILLESVFEGGILVSREDLVAAVIAAALVGGAGAVLPEDADRARAARGGRRPPGRAVDRHSAEPHLGDRLVGGRLRRAGRRHDLGQQARRAVLAVAGRAEGAAGRDPRRLHLGARRDRRRADHRRRREARPRSTSVRCSAAASRTGSPTCWRSCSCSCGPQGLFGEKHHRPGLRAPRSAMIYRETGQFKTTYRADQQIFPILQDRWSSSALLLAFAFVVRAAVRRASTCFRAILDPVPHPLAGGDRPQHAGRLLRPDLARHRRVHGGRRLRRLQRRRPRCRT